MLHGIHDCGRFTYLKWKIQGDSWNIGWRLSFELEQRILKKKNGAVLRILGCNFRDFIYYLKGCKIYRNEISTWFYFKRELHKSLKCVQKLSAIGIVNFEKSTLQIKMCYSTQNHFLPKRKKVHWSADCWDCSVECPKNRTRSFRSQMVNKQGRI